MAVSDNKITRFRGDTYPLIITLKENGVAVDLTGATVRMTIGLDSSVLCDAVITDETGGVAQFNFDESHVGSVGIFSYDIQVISGGYITTYVKDEFELIQDVTI